ncbi:uncharacterized protein SEPMUDRAFT_149842 [Sphaerulina musiva SO2202]|uniref:Uncharacterized protein n=1 Tax=Sphaerulina musiva (strain SO2202) TaxID=692275 RepID=N1QHX7_SPHMS|nr:uncharacterized protein SEPMUDRAFT_149842 [Sphaerulina musiva SO2202]EMF12059.1 hypothetical protein SEPMUDRAFT_149842 [Sphaerulina musiva SO2202]
MSQSLNSALADRDVNASIASNAQVETAPGEENTKMQGEQHKAVSGLNGKSNGTYVSPSDAILSPASQKLAGFKQRQINKQNSKTGPTARSLFSRTASTASQLEDSDDVKQ